MLWFPYGNLVKDTSLIHLLIQTQLDGFLNSFLEDYLVGNLWSFFYFWIKLHVQIWYKLCPYLPKLFKSVPMYFSSCLLHFLEVNYTVFIKFVYAILPKSRRTVIDCQLNSLLGNCLKNQLVGFRWADVLGLSLDILLDWLYFLRQKRAWDVIWFKCQLDYEVFPFTVQNLLSNFSLRDHPCNYVHPLPFCLFFWKKSKNCPFLTTPPPIYKWLHNAWRMVL